MTLYLDPKTGKLRPYDPLTDEELGAALFGDLPALIDDDDELEELVVEAGGIEPLE